MTADDDFDERVERVDTGVSIEIRLKRGEGTRDEDQLKAKVKSETLAQARDDVDALKPDLERWAEELREIQPGGGDE